MERMLLSHNFNLYNNELPALSREQFAAVFIEGLKEFDSIQCNFIKNPHWIVEILYSEDKFTAKEIADLCCKILVKKRQTQKSEKSQMPNILFLGGKKTTPPISNSETALQPSNWGVDVVETPSADTFLTSINWDSMTANKPIENLFKIEYLEGAN